MTVQTTVSRADYNCNGATTAFTVPFYFIQSSHVRVLLTNIATGVSTTLVQGSDYNVSGAGNSSGGSVTTTTAYPSGYKLTILRNVPFTQLTAYPTNGPFPAASHERALDQLTMEVQQLGEAVGRSITLPAATTGVTTDLPAPVANDFLAWNAAGTGLTNVDASSLLTVAASSGFAYNTFTGDGVTTAFTLSANPGAVANLVVGVGGVLQVPGDDYTLSGVQLQFTVAPPAGVKILTRWGQTLGVGIPSDASVSTVKIADGALTADAVGRAKMANGFVTASLLAAGAAVLSKLDTTGTAGQVLTAAGGGGAPIWAAPPQIESIAAAIGSNALTLTYTPQRPMQFRNPTLGNGAPVSASIASALSLTIPAGATLGSVSGSQSTFVWAVLYNGGSPVLAVANIAGGLDMSETGLITSTAISSGATSNATWYSASAVTSSPYRIVAVTEQTEATAGTYATAPSLVQGVGGEAFAALNSIGYGQSWQNLSGNRFVGSTYYNTTSRPIQVSVTISPTTGGPIAIFSVNGVQAGYSQFVYNSFVGSINGVIVPPGASYVLSISGSASLASWYELR